MKLKITSGVFALAVLVASSGAWGDSCHEDLLTASKQSQVRGLWAHDMSDNRWVPVSYSQTLASASIDRFAYIGRKTRKVDNSEGALSVKILSVPLPGADTATKYVLLRRTTPESNCGVRSYLLWYLTHIDFLIGLNVSVNDYIEFHATDSDAIGTIARFHADYIDAEGYCANSSTNDKRSAFLIEHHSEPIRGSDAVIATIKRFFDVSSKASDDPDVKAKNVKVPSVIKDQLTKFRQYSEVETQVHTYGLNGDPVCVAFSDRYRTGSSEIEIVDLDATRGSAFRRSRLKINWR